MSERDFYPCAVKKQFNHDHNGATQSASYVHSQAGAVEGGSGAAIKRIVTCGTGVIA